MALPEDLTRAGNGSFVPITWAEGGAVTEPSAGRKTTGWQASDVVTKEELNWLSREPFRWLRAVASRYLESSDALSSSWLVPNGSGVWSTDGVGALQGFLSDAPTGTTSLVADVWADPNDAGAVRVQVDVAKASPHTFPATRDSYVFVPIDLIAPPTVTDAELTYLDVPVGDPAPATPAGTVAVWRVETDGSTIVDQEILLLSYPTLKTVAFEALQTISLMMSGDLDVGGALDVSGLSTFSNDVDINAILTVTDTLVATQDVQLLTDNTTFFSASGNCTIGLNSSSVHTCNGVMTFSHGLTVPAASPNDTQLLNDVVIGDSAAKTCTVDAVANFGADMSLSTTQTFTLNGTAKVSGGSTSRVETGTVKLQSGAAAPSAEGEIAAATGGTPVFYADGAGHFTFGGLNGSWVEQDADQVPVTSLLATTTLTTSSKTNVNGLLRIRAKGEVQRSAAGALRISLEQDQGTSTWVAIDNSGVTTKNVTSVDTSDADDWTPIQIERTFGAGATDTFFRLKVEGLGGATARIRDTHLTVRRQGA